MEFFDLMSTAAKDVGIELTKEQYEKFIKYMRLVQERNEKINLTAITEDNEFVKKHFIDCIKAFKSSAIKEAKTLIDVGTGAGFPGLPIAILSPETKVTLLDSLNKRINFLKEVSDELGFDNIDFIHGRSEDFGKNPQYREKFDMCVSRAVANLATLSEFCVPFVKVGGSFVSYKAGDCGEEVSVSKKAVDKMGGKISKQLEYVVPTSDLNRVLLLIEKEKATPKSFPRKAGTPAKEPIK